MGRERGGRVTGHARRGTHATGSGGSPASRDSTTRPGPRLGPRPGRPQRPPPGTHNTNPRHERIAMFGIIMTTRGSAAPCGRPDRDRIYRFPGGEATGPEDRAGPAAPAGRGRQAAGGPAHGPRLFESKSRSPGEADIERARRLLAADLTYVAHPSFHDPGARDAILAPAPGHEPSSPEGGFPSREQEAH